MKKRKNKTRISAFKKETSLLSEHFFRMSFVVLLLIGGFHAGVYYALQVYDVDGYVRAVVIMIYWILIAALLTNISRRTVKKAYDEPLMTLANAAKKVAGGDFSVRVPTIHKNPKKYNYLDLMILDFNKMAEELSSTETLKIDFFSNVSHEMKTPLAIIGSNAQLLAEGDGSPEERKECAENILYALRRTNDLVTNMLKLNKLENLVETAPSEYDVCEQLAECVFFYDEIIEKKKIDFEADIEEQAFICADEELMMTVWTNLFSNAVKFTPEGGKIRLVQRTVGGFVEISVSDTGCGMSDEVKKHIFEKFYQGDRSHSFEGNGLGLALVKMILERSNGTVSVESAQGVGSVFTVRLPAVNIK